MYAANQTILIVIDALRYDYLSRFKLVKELTEKFP